MDRADVCWTVSAFHNKEEYKELESTQKPLMWNIEWVNLAIRACNNMVGVGSWLAFTYYHE